MKEQNVKAMPHAAKTDCSADNAEITTKIAKTTKIITASREHVPTENGMKALSVAMHHVSKTAQNAVIASMMLINVRIESAISVKTADGSKAENANR